MTTKFFIFILCIWTLISCGPNEKSRDKFKFSHKLNKDITIETFNVFGQGAWGADLYGEWLTDSTNFRVFIGTCDFQNTHLIVDCISDTLFIKKKADEKIIEKSIYIISELKDKKTHDE